ncbi:MAG: hypothetical protein KGJ77_11930, partial [Acidobacteriota bacterium]|nr:hypothetical protein [Acidobacteriota bacterium]
MSRTDERPPEEAPAPRGEQWGLREWAMDRATARSPRRALGELAVVVLAVVVAAFATHTTDVLLVVAALIVMI